jgi:hypothetical protein
VEIGQVYWVANSRCKKKGYPEGYPFLFEIKLDGLVKNFFLLCQKSQIAGGSKNPEQEDMALILPRGDLLCWSFIDLLKFQISNSKYFTLLNNASH